MLNLSDLKTGKIYKENGIPYVVESYSHKKVARGGATVKLKVRDLLSGSQSAKSYSGNMSFEEADVMRKNAQYLYKDGSFVFMDPDSYEQFRLSEEVIGEPAQFLTDGAVVQVMYYEGRPVSIELPNNLDFEVTYTEPGYKGNTVSNVYKDATLDNGATAKVPSFIKIGDRVKIDTRTGEYVSKA